MADFYWQIRLVHIGAVYLSGSIFFIRGLALLAGGRWPLAAPVRYFSYTVDTILLTAALMLIEIVRQFPFVHAWLTVKILLIVVYIALGIYAFNQKRKRPYRISAWITALLLYLFVISIARAHHPLGIFKPILE